MLRQFQFSVSVTVTLLIVGTSLISGCAEPHKTSSIPEIQTMTTGAPDDNVSPEVDDEQPVAEVTEAKHEVATLGAGCFWCVEAVFKELEGVLDVESGYMGGHVINPTYEQVCSKTTGHAEVCRLTYDPAKITFDEILQVFWTAHDPTTLNRQGADEGPQYRSAVFYHSDEQKQLAKKYKKELDESGAFRNPIVTEITAASVYYKAEGYHQDYYELNPNDRYCQLVAQPKIDKVRKVFKDKLKKDTDSGS